MARPQPPASAGRATLGGPADRADQPDQPDRPDRWIPVLCMGAAVLCATVGGAEPTGNDMPDLLLRGGFGALLAASASRADWPALLILTGSVAALGRPGVGMALGMIALLLTVAATRTGPAARRPAGERPLGAQAGGIPPLAHPMGRVAAVAGGMAATGLTLLADFGVSRLSAALAVMAFLPVVVSGYRGCPRATRRWVHRMGGAVALIVAASGVALALAGLEARSAADRASALASEGLALARSGDSTGAAAKFHEAGPLFGRARHEIEAPWLFPALLVPGVTQNAEAAKRLASAGEDLAGGAAQALARADYRRVRIDQGQVDLRSLAEMVGPIGELNEALRRGAATIDDTDTTWLVPQVRAPLDEMRGRLADAREEGITADLALRVAPALLGGQGERRYFIAFTNPAEARSLGGFIGNYGILHCTDGKVTLETDGGIDDLTFSPGTRAITDPRLDEFARAQAAWSPATYFQNLTATPDPTTSALAIADLYPQTADGHAIDGVLTIDPYGLAALMALTGPIDVEGIGEPLSKDNAADYLIKRQYELFADRELRPQRKDLLEVAAHATFDALTNKALPGPAAIGRALGPAVRGGRIRFVAFAPAESALATRVGLTDPFGAIEGSDVLSLRTSNTAGNKLDTYLRRASTYDVTVDPDRASMRATLTVRLTNEAPAGLPDYVQGNTDAETGDGTNTQLVVVYSPLDVEAVRLDGVAVPFGPSVELGLHSYTNRIDIPRGQTRTLTYELAGPLPSIPHRPTADLDRPTAADYRLELGHQPTVLPDQVELTVRDPSGRLLHREDFELEEDRSVTVRLR